MEERHNMTAITIIGSGNMANAIATRAVQHGHTVEIMSRKTDKAQALAAQIGSGTTVGTYGAQPLGDIVFLAVLADGAVDVAKHYGDALAGRIVVETTNPFNADASGLVTSEGNSIAQQIAAAAPEGTQVLKAFNTIFQPVLASGEPLDVFFAGGNAEARARLAEFLTSLDFRPLDVGGLEMTYVLEWMGILIMGVARNSTGFNVALGAEER